MPAQDLAPLNVRQEAFVQAYVAGGLTNATAAAVAAGYSKGTAGQTGYKLLADPRIKARVAAVRGEYAEAAKLRAEDVVARLSAIADGKITDVATWDEAGNVVVKAAGALTDAQARAVKKIKQTTTQDGKKILEIEMESRTPALHLLGQYHGLFKGQEGQALVVNMDFRFGNGSGK